MGVDALKKSNVFGTCGRVLKQSLDYRPFVPVEIAWFARYIANICLLTDRDTNLHIVVEYSWRRFLTAILFA
jgi:hypothetical protein